jgi:hypothetical protein
MKVEEGTTVLLADFDLNKNTNESSEKAKRSQWSSPGVRQLFENPRVDCLGELPI